MTTPTEFRAILGAPIYLRDEAEEEEWWAAVAAERGMSLDEFDLRCDNLPAPAPAEEEFQHE